MQEELKRWLTMKSESTESRDFLRVEKGPWRGYVREGYEDLFLITENEKGWFDRAIRIFNRTPNKVYEVPFPFGDDLIYIVIKSFGWRERLHYWISPFMKSKAFHSLIAALSLREHGLGTPKPLAAFEKREKSLVSGNVYVSESLGETISLRDVLRKSGEKPLSLRLIKKAGYYVKRMHDAGIFHGDLTLANFLIKNGEEEFYLIDLNRSRPKKRKLNFLERVEDIAKMDFTEEEFSTFLKAYSSPKAPSKKFENMVIFRSRWKKKSRDLRKNLTSRIKSSLKALRFGHES